MKNISLLAASISLALVGCGSSDNDSSSSTELRTITAMDGYFKNAIVFVDKNNNGALDIGTDTLLGMTNDQGQLKIAKDTTGVIAIKTLTSGDISLDAFPEYKNKYTVDMDHPEQTISKAVVLRAPENSPVISPITDLVAIEMKKSNKTETEAQDSIKTALGLAADAELYIDFVEGEDKDSKLHKTAQILMASKAADESDYESNPIEFAQKVDEIIDTLTPSELEDDNYKPVVVKDDNGFTETKNSKLTVSKEAVTRITAAFNALNLTVGQSLSLTDIDLAGLFNDKDVQPDGNITPTLVRLSPASVQSVTAAGFSVSNPVADNYLFGFSSSEVKSDNIFIEFSVTDVDENGADAGTVSVIFDININSENTKPTIVKSKADALQTTISAWDMQQGEAFEQTFSATGLFTDKEGDELTLTAQTSVEGLVASLDKSTNIVTVSGTPVKAYDGGRLYVSADDGMHGSSNGDFVHQIFMLPEIKAGTTPPVEDTTGLLNTTWYMLEHGSSDGDGDDTNNFTRGWCDTYRFSDGIVYKNTRTPENRTTCTPTADTQEDKGSYTVADGKITATFEIDEGSYTIFETLVLTNEGAATGISDTARIISSVSTEKGKNPRTDRLTFFKKIENAEKYIQIKSSDGSAKRESYTLVAQNDISKWDKVKVTVSLTQANANDQGVMDANMIFDLAGADFNCDNVKTYFDSFLFSGIGESGEVFKHSETSQDSNVIECYTSEEGEGDEKIEHANVDFDLPALKVGEVYSMIAWAKDKDDGKAISSDLVFNIEWTGEGNNE